jgi:hypothetical protein
MEVIEFCVVRSLIDLTGPLGRRRVCPFITTVLDVPWIKPAPNLSSCFRYKILY